MQDRVTHVQSGLGQLSSLLFTTVGVLQRDAPPVGIPDFPLTTGAHIAAFCLFH